MFLNYNYFLKYNLVLSLIFVSINLTIAQSFTSSWVNSLEKLDKTEQIELVVQTLLKDTAKYNQNRLYASVFGMKSTTHYTPLIIVNNTNIYQLNTMNKNCASTFISTFFSPKYLKSLNIVPTEEAKKIYGNAGKNGVINLKVKKYNKLKNCDCNLSTFN